MTNNFRGQGEKKGKEIRKAYVDAIPGLKELLEGCTQG